MAYSRPVSMAYRPTVSDQGRWKWGAEGAAAPPLVVERKCVFILGRNRNHMNPSILFVGKAFAENIFYKSYPHNDIRHAEKTIV